MTTILVQVSKDAILDENFGTDDQAEASCEKFGEMLKSELEKLYPESCVEVEITEHEDKQFVDDEPADLLWFLALNHITSKLWETFEWVIS